MSNLPDILFNWLPFFMSRLFKKGIFLTRNYDFSDKSPRHIKRRVNHWKISMFKNNMKIVDLEILKIFVLEVQQ